MIDQTLPHDSFGDGAGSIVGRAREQAALHHLLRAARGGRGSLVLIGGEAGIGKTTLVDWLAGEALADGWRLLRGSCSDLDLTAPYGPWCDALAALDPGELPAGADNPFRRRIEPAAVPSQAVLFDLVRALLAGLAASRPLVLVLEDLHWSDPASLDLLRHLARHVASMPLLLIATYRHDEVTRRHRLFALLPLLARESRAIRVDPSPLADEDVRALVAARYPLAAADEARLVRSLQGRAGGNPFSLGEILRTLEGERLLRPGDAGWVLGDLDRAPVPPLIRQIVEGRLAGLRADERTLLEAAAVIGQEVPFALWQAAGDVDPDRLAEALERATDAHLLRAGADPAVTGFAHALVRETLYHGLSLPRRQALHRRVAELLSGRPEPPLIVVAGHFARADDPRAIDWLLRAGDEALALYAAQDAVAALTRAHDLAGRFARELPSAGYRARAAAAAMLGDFDGARRDHELVLTRARAAGDTRAEWQALLDLGMHWAERDYERTGAYYDAALTLARRAGDAGMIAASLNHVGNRHANLGDPTLALSMHEEALALFEMDSDRHGTAETLDFLGMTNYLACDAAASVRACERAIALFRDLGDRRRLASSLAAIAYNGSELPPALAPVFREETYWLGCAEESVVIAREIGWPAGEAFALVALAYVTGTRGDMGRGLREARAALAIAERIDHRQWAILARSALGSIWFDLLDEERAAAELEEALTAARRSGSRFWIDAAVAALASVRVATGDLDQAEALLGTVPRAVAPQPSLGERLFRGAHAKLLLARGEAARALETIEAVAGDELGPRPERTVPYLAKLRGDALRGLGRLDEAAAAYAAARDSAALFGFRPFLWRVETARGDLFAAAGRPADAQTAYATARALIDQIAASLDDAAMGERFRTRASAFLPSERQADRTAGNAALLSPRELEVLRLVVDGLSDREIAGALSISPRTVMRHVSGILDKFGVPSRTAAAAAAIRRGIV